MSDWIDDLSGRVGRPNPCDLCGSPTVAADLTETTIPDRVLDFGVFGLRAADREPVILWRVIWVCPRCPY